MPIFCLMGESSCFYQRHICPYQQLYEPQISEIHVTSPPGVQWRRPFIRRPEIRSSSMTAATWRWTSGSATPRISRSPAVQVYVNYKLLNNCVWFKTVLRIRIRIHMFLGLLDPDPLVRGMDPVRSRIRILLSWSKKSKKNLDIYCFVTFFTFYLWKVI